jgi:hypothetical protein
MAKIIKCERCDEVLKPERVIWLELSNNGGKYYIKIPKGQESQ